MNQPDFNIVSNQGYAQIVGHVHFHLVPAPRLNGGGKGAVREGWASLVGREELDDEEAKEIVGRIKVELEKEERGSKL